MSTISGSKTSGFKTFPEFSKLKFADRKHYESLISNYPPISDISFPMLMVWWNWLDSCAISTLNGNLVISYWFPGEERYSGLSILGTNKIDESICAIFDYLREQGKPVRLVHVPEFVLSHIQYPELFTPKGERAFDELLLSVSKFYPLSQAPLFRRRRVRRFLADIDESRIVVKTLDLSMDINQQQLLTAAATWEKKGGVRLNHIAKNESEAMRTSITHADIAGIDNLCLFIDGELHGFSLHQLPHDRRYVTGLHVRTSPELPHTFDYMMYAFARWLADQGVAYINLKYDLGILSVRMFKLTLGPVGYFKKYSIYPAEK